jgi:hypothetical protein
MNKIYYVTVSTADYNALSSRKNVEEILKLVASGYEIISAVGDGAGAVHYILEKPEATPTKLPPPRETRKFRKS